MPNTQREREPLFSYDHELERTLCNINRNLEINDDNPNNNILDPVDVHGKLLPNAPLEKPTEGTKSCSTAPRILQRL